MEHRNLREILIYFALKYQGKYLKVYNAIAQREGFDENEIANALSQLKCSTVTLIDDDYPKVFRSDDFPNPPIVLFYKGDIQLLDSGVMKMYLLKDRTRFITAINPTEENGKIVFEYVVCCECYDNVSKMYEHMKSKGLNIKDHEREEDVKCH